MKPPQRRSPPRRRVDGVLLLDKPSGLSSNAALQHVRRLYRAEKAGHTGTLDPLASGLLPVCFGEATKFAQLLLDADKAYAATLRLGVTTTTGDAEGEALRERAVTVARAEFEALLPRFVGHLSQLPPRHAALKYQGRNYYEYARAGIEIPRQPRPVVVTELRLDEWAPPLVRLTVRCGKGTYVRVLAEDLGEAAGCGAHLAALRRTRTGPFELAAAATFDTLAALDDAGRDRLLLPVDAPCAGLARCDLTAAEGAAWREGRSLARPGLADATYRVYAAGQFAGVATAVAGTLRPRRLLAARPAEPFVESVES